MRRHTPTRSYCTHTNPMRALQRRGKSTPATHLRRHTVPANNLFELRLADNPPAARVDTDAVTDHDPEASSEEFVPAPIARIDAALTPHPDPVTWAVCIPTEILTARGLAIPRSRKGSTVASVDPLDDSTNLLTAFPWAKWARAGREVHVVVWDTDIIGGVETPVFPVVDEVREILPEVVVHAAMPFGSSWVDVLDGATPLFVARTEHQDRVRRKLRESLASDEARRIRSVTDTRPLLELIPTPAPLDEVLADAGDPEPFAVAGALPAGGNTVVIGPGKLGKTTLIGNLCAAFVDGRPFLGAFATERRTVTVLDFELPNGMGARWLDDLDIVNRRDLRYQSLRGLAHLFDLRDADVRQRWADNLAGTQVLVIDCLKPILTALDLDEDRDVRKFLDRVDQLKEMAGISECIIVHHVGHTNQDRPRGDSDLIGWPDALWVLSGTPSGVRSFGVTSGRDTDVPVRPLTFHDRHLTYQAAENPAEIAKESEALAREESDASMDAEVLEYLSGCAAAPNMKAFDAQFSAQKKRTPARAALRRLIDAGAVCEVIGTRNTKTLHAVSDQSAVSDA